MPKQNEYPERALTDNTYLLAEDASGTCRVAGSEIGNAKISVISGGFDFMSSTELSNAGNIVIPKCNVGAVITVAAQYYDTMPVRLALCGDNDMEKFGNVSNAGTIITQELSCSTYIPKKYLLTDFVIEVFAAYAAVGNNHIEYSIMCIN